MCDVTEHIDGATELLYRYYLDITMYGGMKTNTILDTHRSLTAYW